MSDVVVTIPQRLWENWIAEGDLPGEEAQYESHFWLPRPLPKIAASERVYVVAHGALRGYAPLVRAETYCQINPGRGCLLRTGGAVAVTILEEIAGFRGYRYRWWSRDIEVPFPGWKDPRARLTWHDAVQQPGLFGADPSPATGVCPSCGHPTSDHRPGFGCIEPLLADDGESWEGCPCDGDGVGEG